MYVYVYDMEWNEAFEKDATALPYSTRSLDQDGPLPGDAMARDGVLGTGLVGDSSSGVVTAYHSLTHLLTHSLSLTHLLLRANL